MTTQQLILRGVERGLIKLPDAPPPPRRRGPHNIYQTARDREIAHLWEARGRRARNIATGLRYDGKPRVNRSWPELQGLVGRDYRRNYVRLWRRLKADHAIAEERR